VVGEMVGVRYGDDKGLLWGGMNAEATFWWLLGISSLFMMLIIIEYMSIY
jgi:hypothetical protein